MAATQWLQCMGHALTRSLTHPTCCTHKIAHRTHVDSNTNTDKQLTVESASTNATCTQLLGIASFLDFIQAKIRGMCPIGGTC